MNRAKIPAGSKISSDELHRAGLSGTERSSLVLLEWFLQRCNTSYVAILTDRNLSHASPALVSTQLSDGYSTKSSVDQLLKSSMPSLSIFVQNLAPDRLRLLSEMEKQTTSTNVLVCHNVFGRQPSTVLNALVRHRFSLFAVSWWMAGEMSWTEKCCRCDMQVLYNPVNTYTTFLHGPNMSTLVDADRLIYASAPSKGLDAACRILALAQTHRPTAFLEVYSPAYAAGQLNQLKHAKEAPARNVSGDGIRACFAVRDSLRIHGAKSADAMHQRLRHAFAVLFPGDFLETFGNAHLEANCLGVPVLARALGGLPEVLDSSTEQLLLSSASDDEFAARLGRWWAHGRPHVSCTGTKTIDRAVTPLLEAATSGVHRCGRSPR
jgi:glycosyltransferase involved in cell wall biosynthesis